MKSAIVLDISDVKKLISEKYGVSEKAIIKNPYGFTVMTEDTKEPEENAET